MNIYIPEPFNTGLYFTLSGTVYLPGDTIILEVKILMIGVILSLLLCVNVNTTTAVEVLIILMEEAEGSGTSLMGPCFSTLQLTLIGLAILNKFI